ncbi:TetR/AcrR family transcriptional regulator [Vagococcus silagei]|uniref:TetR/AcrR family transcriptional regulator n=1 Tax=Vagococcus silagei TaxID=2508885 RepID=A0A4S3B263_9ENTE|nr:TetR/AcrR family transcriptional regulator [Vagococcus silagei]THB60327.1 TetR/AcrR family transcriptional regulator [Vagococcus silagei]
MARNKYPEESRQKILEVAEKLFLEKGYDATTIQDIVKGLGGMTKGVIYHHFNSKIDILNAVMEESDTQENLQNWRGNTGLEKLQNSLMDSFSSLRKQEIGYSAGVTLKSPRILGEKYLMTFEQIVPELTKVVEEGIEDGSITTDDPKEVAELMMLTLNLWIGIQITSLPEEELYRKVRFVKKTFEGLGIPLLNDELIQTANHLIYYLKNN